MKQGSTRQAARRGTVGLALAAVAMVAAAGAAGAAGAADSNPAPRKVTVKPAQVLTDAGFTVKAGESITITASGRIHFGGGKITSLTPAGIPRGPECEAISINQPRSDPWPAPGLSCWSLIGKVKGGQFFEVGLRRTFQPQVSGELYLGVNDNYVSDNSGSWSATVAITPAGVKPTTPTSGPATTNPATGGATGSNGGKSKSSSTIFIVIGAVVVLVLLAFLFRMFAGRKRKGEDAEPAPIIPPPAPVAAAVPGAPNPYASIAAQTGAPPAPEPEPDPALFAAVPAEPPTPIAPPETDSIDVNIFEVEFNNGLTLRVGYNHFPEGTTIRWKVTQNRIPVSSGHFVAKGGGSTNHFETVPLGIKLEGRDARPDGADVHFDWEVNGVPFRYSVRRDPNC